MDETRVEWLPDGFRLRFEVEPLPGLAARPELMLLYAAVVGVVAASVNMALGTLLFAPPALLTWWAARRHEADLEVTHGRLVARAPLRSTVRLDLREVREVEVFDQELELELWGGGRVRVPSPTPGRRLQWVVRKIRELRDESQAFALEMAQDPQAGRVKGLLQGPR